MTDRDRHGRRRRAAACALAAALILLAATGCAADPIGAWQASVEKYVAEVGNGDLNVLRSVGHSPAESDFGLIGAAQGGVPFFRPRRTDADGVLVGRRVVDERGWYVFLLGLVRYRGRDVDWPLDDARVTDVRVMALARIDDEIAWRVGGEDKEALERYRAPQIEAWRRSHPDRAGDDEDDAPTTFPTPADRLELLDEDGAFTVVDEHSGAEWELAVRPDHKSGQSPGSGRVESRE